MQLRTKIKLSLLIVLVLSNLGVNMISYIAHESRNKMVEKKYKIEDMDERSIAVQLFEYEKDISNVTDLIIKSIKEKDQRLDDPEYIRDLEDKIKAKGFYLIVEKDGELLYDGMPQGISIAENLTDYHMENQERENAGDSFIQHSYIFGRNEYLVKQFSFFMDDHKQMTFHFITSILRPVNRSERTLREMQVMFIVMEVLAASALGRWIQKQIMKSLQGIREASQRIADGQLDQPVRKAQNDEFGELYAFYEELRIRLKQSMEEKNKHDNETKEIIRNISHDLKTPLTTIKGYTEGIMDGVANTPEKTKKYIKTIYQKTNEMEKLIDELSMYSKLELEESHYSFEKVNVKSFFENFLREISPELSAANVSLTFSNRLAGDVEMFVDQEKLTRVFNNLISNCIKYHGACQTQINLRLKESGEKFMIEVEDNGRGISKEELPYIFDRFYRVDGARNSKEGGSGIGLSIVKKIIENHDGSVWASSVKHEGTIIHIMMNKAQ